MRTLLQRIDDSVVGANRKSRRIIELGAFVVMIDPHLSYPYCNYAIALNDGPFSGGQIQEFIQVFRESDRAPRLEYRSAVAPNLAKALEAHGFALERDDPVMVCTPQDLRKPTREHTTELVNATNIVPFSSVLGRAFGTDGSVNQDEADAAVDRIARGFFVSALARVDGTVAGGATLVIHDDVAELAGVGTAPEFQRLGVASAVSYSLIQHFFANSGTLVWLSAGNPGAEATYAGLGFRRVGSQLNYSILEESDQP